MTSDALRQTDDGLDSEALDESGGRLEQIDGRTVRKAMPGGEHSDVFTALLRLIGNDFEGGRRDDGTGGWWIRGEITVDYPQFERRLEADVAGWKRVRVPTKPKGFPI